MAYLTTGADLKADALFLAGEPGDGTSTYDSRVYEWLTEIQRKIISGGTLLTATMPAADWYWARAWPRGAIQLVQPYNQFGNDASASFTTGSTTVTLNTVGADLPDLAGYRILRSDTPARHLINQIINVPGFFKTVLLREPWTGDTVSDTNWLAYPDTYQLPEDFVRGSSPLFLYAFPSNLPTTQTIDVIDPVDLERIYPQTFPWGGNSNATVTGSGLPVLAARVTDSRIRFSHFLNNPNASGGTQVEFEYIRRPAVIADGVIPVIPIEHRRILSLGCAALILNDKGDTKQTEKVTMFTAQYSALRDEHARDMRRMSSRWGVVQPPRSSGNRAILLTETGLPIYGW